MKATLIFSTMAALLAGCEDSHSVDSKDAAPPPSPLVITLRQMSLFPGSTNAGIAPNMVLNLSRDTPAANPALIAQELEKTLFMTTDGEVVRVSPIVPQTDDRGDFLLAVAPATPLLTDMWYDVIYPSIAVVFPNGLEVKLKILADSTYYLGEGVVTRFFTSSAPQLREVDVMVSGDGGIGTSNFLVQLSEPVSLVDLLSGGFLATASSPLNGTCLIGGRDCWESVARPGVQDSGVTPVEILDSGEVLPPPGAMNSTSWFVYQLEVEVPIRFEIALAMSLRGSARTVQEAVNAGAIRGTTTVSDGFLRYPMDVSSWRRRNAGTKFGWVNVD